MNFFNQMYEKLEEGIPLKLVLAKSKDKIVVSVIPDSDDESLTPATISGLPEEVDSAFFAALGQPISDGVLHVNQQMVKAATAKKEKEPEKKEPEKKETDLFEQKKPEAEKPKEEPVKEESKEEPATKPVAKGFRAPRAEADKPVEAEVEDKLPWEGEKESNNVEPDSSEDKQETVFDDDDDWS
jgi:hypothetical protein